MCGFAGFVSFGRQALAREERLDILRAMSRAIAHRGPDDEQFYDDGVLSLAFRRLSIVDLAGGRQPLFSEDGNRLIVVNGEIYNHESLRSELGARHRFATHSDSEAALHLIGEHDAEGLARLHGMFALAFWDRSRQRLLLARDRLGIKPLYVARLPDGLLFGSELKALIAHPRCPRELDWSVLDVPVAQMRSPVATYVRGVEHLPGGHWMAASAEKTETRAWWALEDHLGSARCGTDAAAYRREYARLLETATAEHLMSDVTVGLHLSGGLDSTLLAGIVGARGRRLACFSVVERGSFLSGDVASARRTTARLGLPWFPVLFDYRTQLDAIAFDLVRLEQSVWMMDSPRFDPEWIFKEELHRAARRECPDLKVVLLGQGADEFAGGYSRRIDRPRGNWAEYIDDEVRPNLRFYDALEAHTPAHLCQLRTRRASERPLRASYHEMMRRLALQLQHYNLWHEDRTSMSQSMEARVPFLDHRLVELLASVPGELHAELFWNKSIVRGAAQPYLPDFDPRHPKVPFIDAGDTRSIDIMVHMMLQRTVPAFLSKYPDLPSFPFDRDALGALAHSVLERHGTFYVDGARLMECMVIAIFAEQCRAPAAQDFRAQRERKAGPALVADADWPAIKKAFEAVPVISSLAWRADDHIGVAAGAEIVQPADPEGKLRFLLVTGGQVAGEIRIPAQLDWVPRLLRNLTRAETAGFTIADWEDEFEVAPPDFRGVLDILYQAGFLRRVRHAATPAAH